MFKTTIYLFGGVMRRLAFTLIELLVYVALFSFFTLLITGFGQMVFSIIKQRATKTSGALRNAVVCDLMRKDLMSALMEKDVWDTSAFVFKKECVDAYGRISTVCVGWECVVLKHVQLGVRRSEGIYDFVRHCWKQRTFSLLGCALRDMRLSIELSKDRRRVMRALVRYADDSILGVSRTERVSLRNRVLV
jgi:hypothetical protein